MSMIHPYLTDGTKSDQSIWEIATTVVGESEAVHPVGTRGVLPDGRVFYYARQSAAAAIVAGKLLGAELQTDQFVGLAVDTPAIGSLTITPTLGSTAVTLNEYAEGYCIVVDDTGEGISYKIESCVAAAGSAACALTLHDPVQVALGAGATVDIVKNLWADVIPATAGQVHVSVGISQVAVPAGNVVPQYFWCQTWGICPAWHGEATTIGTLITSAAAESEVELRNGAGEPIVGISIWKGVDTEYQPIFLTIAP
jgi:hypothetical protein